VAELAAAGRASVVVPFPAAADQHQSANARALERAGAARVIEQSALTPQGLLAEVRSLLERPDRLAQMERNARKLARPDAAERIAGIVERLAFNRRPSAFETPGR
jgi:UDP-N-acetylglucosamine--N-acetylmuramyl-(pentapeptide) pyrophosphoryl-undecaprenol N-acetylglucosamine transferase